MLKYTFLIVIVLIRASASGYFNCTNDFDKEMTCEFTPKQAANCREYSVNVTYVERVLRIYNCSPILVGNGKCGCTIHVEEGFIIGEEAIAKLTRNNQIEINKTISTDESIKPKPPTITSGKETQVGKTKVTWLIHYEKNSVLNLKTELHYKPVKADKWKSTESGSSDTFNEMYLEHPDTDYIFKARVFRVFMPNTTQYSDWSEEFVFRSPQVQTQPENVAKIVVPVLFLILVFTVCTLACWYGKIKKEWSKKPSPSPIIGPVDKKWGQHILDPEKTAASRIEVLILDKTEEEKSIPILSVNGSSGNSSLINSTNSNSTQPDYGEVSRHPLEHVLSAMDKDFRRARQNQPDPAVFSGSSEYESTGMQDSNKAHAPSSTLQSNSGCTSGSSFENRCYSVPTSPSTCQSFFIAPSLASDPGYQSSMSFGVPVLETDECNFTLAPLIQTELDYQPCDACLINEAARLLQSTGKNLQFVDNVKAKDSFVKDMGQGVSTCVDQTLQSINEKKKDSALQLVCSKNPFQICPSIHECSTLLSDDEYRPF